MRRLVCYWGEYGLEMALQPAPLPSRRFGRAQPRLKQYKGLGRFCSNLQPIASITEDHAAGYACRPHAEGSSGVQPSCGLACRQADWQYSVTLLYRLPVDCEHGVPAVSIKGMRST